MGDLSQERLERETLSWAPAVRYLEETDSTNRVAAEWARDGAPEGSLVVADHQTAGRGRLGRSWFSRPGECLLFSVVLRPSVVLEDLGLLSLAAAAAVCSAIEEQGAEAGVKWPNDVIVSDRKVAGILAEAEVELKRAVSVTLGIGINVNVAAEDFPADIRESATSLARETGRTHDRVEVLTGFLQRFGMLYEALPTRHPDELIAIYRRLSITIGKYVKVDLGDRTVEGTAVDITNNGALVLDSGHVLRVGDIVHLR